MDTRMHVKVNKVKHRAFSLCESLSKVYYEGSEKQAGKIEIKKEGNQKLLDAIWFYYSEFKPVASGNFWHYVDGVPTEW